MRSSMTGSRLACVLTLSVCMALTMAACSKTEQQAASSPAAAPKAGAPAATNEAPTAGTAPQQAASQPTPGPSAPAGEAAAAASTPPVAAPPAAPVPPPPPPPRTFTLAAGTVLTVKTVSTLSTDSQAAGNTFKATLADPIVEGDWVVARKGAEVEGVVVAADKGGRVKGTAQLEIAVTSLTLTDGQRISLETSMAAAAAKSEKKKDVGKVAITTGAGAIIGAIAGGGKGAAIGAAVGGAGGTAAVMGTRGGPAVIPAGAELRFKVKSAVEITEKK